MGNLEGKTISGLLEKIGAIRKEIDALENEIRSLAEVQHEEAEASEYVETAVYQEDTPIDLSLDMGNDSPADAVEPQADGTASANGSNETVPQEYVPSANDDAYLTSGLPEPTDEGPAADLPDDDGEVLEIAEELAEKAEDLPANEAKVTEEAIALDEQPSSGLPEAENKPEATDDLPDEYFDEDSDIPEVIHIANYATAPEGEEFSVPKDILAKEAKEKDSKPEDDIPVAEDKHTEDIPAAEDKPAASVPKMVAESIEPETALIDIMTDTQAWRTDKPGFPVKNIISAISLNDRVFLINTLFKEDPQAFQDAIAALNGMNSLDEALKWVSENHADWKLDSEPVYRFMMAVRRKLK